MTFEVSIEIAAAPDVVWAVMADPERWHEWTASIRGIRLLDRGPLRIGTRAIVRQPKFPPALWKVTALEPGRSFTWKAGAPGMWVHGHHAVALSRSGTLATLSVQYDGTVGRLLGRMTRAITEQYLAMEAAGLKQRSEQRARELERDARKVAAR